MSELKALAGAIAIAASIVTIWIFLRRNGQEHPVTKKPYVSAFIVPLIVAAAMRGITFVASALA